MSQLALDYAAHRAVRSTDPGTSAEASARVDRPTGQARVLAAMAKLATPSTDAQIAVAASMPLASSTRRRGELVDLGLADPADTRGVTPSGRRATRWRLTSGP